MKKEITIKKNIDYQTRLNLLTYIVALLQMLYDAIDNLEEIGKANNLFSYNLKHLAKRLKSEAEKVIIKLYDLQGKDTISKEAEHQFYDFKELLEKELELIMYANSEEREELICLLSKIEKRLGNGSK